MRFFRKTTREKTHFPFVDCGVLVGTTAVALWKMSSQYQEKCQLQRDNPGKTIVPKPEKGFLGMTVWKWSVQDESPNQSQPKPR